jgi:hypothetical protein
MLKGSTQVPVALSRGSLWCLTILACALPALLTPLLFLPMPAGFRLPPGVATEWLLVILFSPRGWAGAATLAAVLGARHFAESRLQEGFVAIVLILAWVIGSDSLIRINCIF